MKKVLSLILALSMILCWMATTAVADPGVIRMTVSTAEGKPGDTVELKVTIAENTGVAYLNIPIAYDENRLELTSITGLGLSGWTIRKNAVWADADNSLYTGDILTLSFTIKDNAEPGTAVVNVGTVEAWTATDDEVVVTSVAGGVEVKEAVHTHTYGAPSWTWSGDFSNAVATFACSECGETETVDASVVSTSDGLKIAYTATVVFNGTEYTDTREVEISSHVIALTVSTTEGKPGDTVTVTVTMEENTGVAYLGILIVYDEDRLELNSITGTGLSGWTIRKNAVWVDADNSTYTGDILTLSFTIKEDAVVGTAVVNVGAVEAWTAADEEVVVNSVAGGIEVKNAEPSNITSSSVDFNGKMHLITYIKLSDEVMADANAYITTTFNDVTTDHSVAELIGNLDSQGRVKVKQEMYAAMMRDEMMLQVFDGDGVAQPLTYKGTTDVTDGFVFTALEYLKGRQAESTNPKMVELAKAAELYGIAVQVKFDYHTEQLTAEDIAMMEAAARDITIPATCDEEVTGTLPAGVTKQTKTVMFESDNTLRLYYYIDDASISNYSFTLDGKTVTAAKKEAGKYYVQQENIASGLLSSGYTFTVSDGADTYTVKTSALAYAYGRQENSSDKQMIDLSKLLYRYSLAADAYFS